MVLNIIWWYVLMRKGSLFTNMISTASITSWYFVMISVGSVHRWSSTTCPGFQMLDNCWLFDYSEIMVIPCELNHTDIMVGTLLGLLLLYESYSGYLLFINMLDVCQQLNTHGEHQRWPGKIQELGMVFLLTRNGNSRCESLGVTMMPRAEVVESGCCIWVG